MRLTNRAPRRAHPCTLQAVGRRTWRTDERRVRRGPPPSVPSHLVALDWLECGDSEGDLTEWSDRSLLDLSADDLQIERPIAAKHCGGNVY